MLVAFLSSGVAGEPYDLRLVGGANEWEGRVEVSVNGEWGTVCSLGLIANDFTVICKQLRYQQPLSKLIIQFFRTSFFGYFLTAYLHLTVFSAPFLTFLVTFYGRTFGEGEGMQWFHNFSCSGSEESVFVCPRDGAIGEVDTSCSHTFDASVICQGRHTLTHSHPHPHTLTPSPSHPHSLHTLTPSHPHSHAYTHMHIIHTS